MGFGTAIKTCFKKYADFNGRARRSEFWWFMLFIQLVSLPIAIIASVFIMIAMIATMAEIEQGDSGVEGLVVVGLIYLGMFVVMLPLVIPSYAVEVRRLHDMGQSGWWVLLNFAGLGIVPLIMCVMDSQVGNNQWGPNPKGDVVYFGQSAVPTPPSPAS